MPELEILSSESELKHCSMSGITSIRGTRDRRYMRWLVMKHTGRRVRMAVSHKHGQ
jgi:hypothetical protein